MSNTLQLAKLRKNPFTLAPEANTDIWADYEDVRKALLDVITSCRNDQVGLSEFVVLHGEIGTGKSHALRYLQNYITIGKKQEFRSACVYLESTKLAKKTDFMAIYRRVMEALRNHVLETATRLDSAFEEKAKAFGLTPAQEITVEKDKQWMKNAGTLP